MGKSDKELVNQYYEQFYDENAYSGLNGYLFSFTHKKLELIPRHKKSRKNTNISKVLEVGAGSGQHLKYVKTWSEYTMSDINFSLLQKGIKNSITGGGVKYKVADVQNLPFKDESFDRVISTCLLHHLSDPEKALLEMKRVTKIGGFLSIYLSCDPGIVNRFLRKLLIISKAKKLGFNEYGIFIAREHRNHFNSLNAMVKYLFKNQIIRQKYYPFIIPGWNLNTFCIFQIEIVAK